MQTRLQEAGLHLSLLKTAPFGRAAGRHASSSPAQMGEIGTRKYVGSAFINSSRDPRAALKRDPSARRAATEGRGAANHAMGQAGSAP